MKDFRGVIHKKESGEVVYFGFETLEEIMKNLPPERYRIEIKRYHNQRGLEANRYYWKLIQIAADFIGYEREELHEVLKYKFLKRTKVYEDTGEIYEYIKSTSKLSKQEFSEYIDICKRYLSQELQIKFPKNFL